ncbi:hypothetical protein ERJ75_001833900 [Trypanosoma vivax]|nr:hypothetical protein ERJ75_001833900 [Trypanosoma vivax]
MLSRALTASSSAARAVFLSAVDSAPRSAAAVLAIATVASAVPKTHARAITAMAALRAVPHISLATFLACANSAIPLPASQPLPCLVGPTLPLVAARNRTRAHASAHPSEFREPQAQEAWRRPCVPATPLFVKHPRVGVLRFTRPGGHARCSRSSRGPRTQAGSEPLPRGAPPAGRRPSVARGKRGRRRTNSVPVCARGLVGPPFVSGLHDLIGRQRHGGRTHAGTTIKRPRGPNARRRHRRRPPPHRACANRGAHYGHGRGHRNAARAAAGVRDDDERGVKSELGTRLECWVARRTSRVRQRGQRFTRAQPRHGAPHAWPSERPPGRHAGHAPANSQTPRLARPRERNVARESGSGADNTTARTAPAVTRAGQG